MNDATVIFCMDVGGTRTKYGLVDLSSGRLIAEFARLTKTEGLEAFTLATEKAFNELLKKKDIPRRQIAGVGLGVPGYVAGDFISMVWESLAFMEGTGFRRAVEDRLELPVRMDNDARVVALGEAYLGGHGQPDRLLSLTLGTGLGFGFVVNGMLQESTSINHMSGHIPIRPGARPCYCGFSGCLESLVGAPTIVECFQAKCAQQSAFPCDVPAEPRFILQAAAQGHPLAAQVVQQFLADLITGLNAYLLLFGPDVIVLGGGLSLGLRPWLKVIQDGLFTYPYKGYRCQVRISRLGKQAGLYGAASLWNEQVSFK